MISDWTIYGVYVPKEGLESVACWEKNYAEEYASSIEDLLSTTVSREYPDQWQNLLDWLEENDITSPDVARSLWGQWGLPTWLSEIVDDIKANTDDVFHAPMISVEYDGWEEDCGCESGGKVQCPDCSGSGQEQVGDSKHVQSCTHCEGEAEIECPDCEGNGVTGPRCYECGDAI